MSRSSWMTVVGLAAASALLAVWFARAERETPTSAPARADAPPRATSAELAAPALAETDAQDEVDASESDLSNALPLGGREPAGRARSTASLTLTVVPPPGVVVSEADWQAVSIQLGLRKLSLPRKPRTRGESIVGRPDGVNRLYELEGVRTDVKLPLEIAAPFATVWYERLAPFSLAEHRDVLARLEAGVALSGRVMDERGAPVERVVVRARAPGSQVAPHWDRTDDAGVFRLKHLAGRDWTLDVSATDGIASSESLAIAAPATDVDGLVLHVVRALAIEGTVAWEDGRPVEQGEVHASGPFSPLMDASVSRGRFRLALSQGTYELDVEASDERVVGTAHVASVTTGGEPLHLVLAETPACELRGIVRDAWDIPVHSFTVQCDSMDDGRGPARGEFPGSEDGAFRMTGLWPGEATVEVEARGYYSVEQRVVLGAEHGEPLSFVLPLARSVLGHVLDSAGNPVSQASVSDGGKVVAWSDSDGRFDLMPATAHPTLWATKPGYAASEPLELELGATPLVEGLVLRLRESCRVTGRVLDPDGRPLPGALVYVERAEEDAGWTECDGDARFAFDDVPPGTIELWAMSFDGPEARATVRIEATPRAPSDVEVRLEWEPSVWIDGRIERRGRAMVCGVIVRSGSDEVSARAGLNGRFHLKLPRPGLWKGLLFSKGEASPSADAELRLFELDVPAVEDHRVTLDFDALRSAASLDELGR